ncbi:MAG TPA: selenium-dependent molybdenum cofactor biosynthesis protein YqeB, partial [Thermodesulfobacteriota bacterium]
MTDVPLVAIRGGGDLATGVAYRLVRSGFPVVVAELPAPSAVRRAVCLSEAVYDGRVEIEGLVAVRCAGVAEAREALARGEVPVLVDPEGAGLRALRPAVLVDAIMAKRNTGTTADAAPFVVALGPGFTAGVDCHAVVETQRGHRLGRVIHQGPAAPPSHVPEAVLGRTDRVLRAPAAGRFGSRRRIGDLVGEGEVLGEVAGRPIVAPFAGALRGLVRDGLEVTAGQKVGDLDPRGVGDYCFTISDKALA